MPPGAIVAGHYRFTASANLRLRTDSPLFHVYIALVVCVDDGLDDAKLDGEPMEKEPVNATSKKASSKSVQAPRQR